ncbi:MAG: hypothetical protein HOQ28_02195 [Thermoleophilia bacterium]|nr:hypothetical protein [Thermoleophilia bacterium]
MKSPTGFALVAAACVVLGLASGAAGAPSSSVPDGPGTVSHFDLARKDVHHPVVLEGVAIP